ncbi:MAG: hypothetical protein AB1742_00685 [bacterium]
MKKCESSLIENPVKRGLTDKPELYKWLWIRKEAVEAYPTWSPAPLKEVEQE